MELNYLREFVALAQSCQFQETAEQLFMSQSSLSKHIKAIEKEFGQPLFKRSTRRAELTGFGRAFLPYATQIAALQKEYTEQLLDVADGKTFSLGISPIITLYSLNRFLARFPQAHPEYRFEVKEGGDKELYGMLQRGECDLIIVSESEEFSDVNFPSSPYSSDVLVAVMSASHPLAHKPFITFEDLKEYPLLQKGDLNLAKVFDDHALPAAYITNRESVLLNLLSNTTSVVILTSYAAKDYIAHFPAEGEFVILPLEPQTRLNMVLRYSKAKQFCPVVQSLTEYLREPDSPEAFRQPSVTE